MDSPATEVGAGAAVVVGAGAGAGAGTETGAGTGGETGARTGAFTPAASATTAFGPVPGNQRDCAGSRRGCPSSLMRKVRCWTSMAGAS